MKCERNAAHLITMVLITLFLSWSTAQAEDRAHMPPEIMCMQGCVSACASASQGADASNCQHSCRSTCVADDGSEPLTLSDFGESVVDRLNGLTGFIDSTGVYQAIGRPGIRPVDDLAGIIGETGIVTCGGFTCVCTGAGDCNWMIATCAEHEELVLRCSKYDSEGRPIACSCSRF